MTHIPMHPGYNPERDAILDAHNSLQTNPPEVQQKTRQSTQWGPAGIGAQMTCGATEGSPACEMFTPDEHTNYQDGYCALGWRTFRRYACNEWQPGTTDHDADDRP